MSLLGLLVDRGWSPLLRWDRWFGAQVVELGASQRWLQTAADTLGMATRDVGSAAVVLVAVALLWQHHQRAAQWLAASAIIGFAVQNAVKALVGRVRPVWPGSPFHLATPAFPSGHAMSGIDLWVVLGVLRVLAPLGRPARWVGALVIAVGVLMGPSRLILGVHWSSDVLAGWLLGAAAACAAAALVGWRANVAAARP